MDITSAENSSSIWSPARSPSFTMYPRPHEYVGESSSFAAGEGAVLFLSDN